MNGQKNLTYLMKRGFKFMMELVILAICIIALTAIIFFIAGYYSGRAFEHIAVEELIEKYYGQTPEAAAPVEDTLIDKITQ